MQTLEPPDTHLLSATVGWLELGNVEEAKAEFEKVSQELRGHPDVLEVHWLVHAQEKNWDDGLAIAQALVATAPERSSGWLHQSYAMRRATDGGLQAAWDALVPAFKMFPKEPTIPYNLSCYACQMGQLDEARLWLDRAIKVGSKEKIKFMALNDADLEPLREEIKEL
jgi:tetratricopeptide (TPR) repeat protein